jgi:hypothetical protein
MPAPPSPGGSLVDETPQGALSAEHVETIGRRRDGAVAPTARRGDREAAIRVIQKSPGSGTAATRPA